MIEINNNCTKLSYIVPVYKIEENLLKGCINSLINQSYTNFEVILINDGSPDNCPVICDEFAQKDKRIMVIHKKNAGTAAARNDGLKKASGDYICFVDADDYFDFDIASVVFGNGNELVDIIWFDVMAERSNKTELWKNGNIKGVVNFTKTLSMFLKNEIIQSCWAKFISKKCIGKNLLNEQLQRGQDEEFIIRILLGEGTCMFLHKVGYYYNIRESSATNTTFTNKVFDICEMTELVRSEVLEKYSHFESETNTYIANGLWLMAVQYKKSSTDTDEFKNKFMDELITHKSEIFLSKLPVRQKLILLFFAIVGPENGKKYYQQYKQLKG